MWPIDQSKGKNRGNFQIACLSSSLKNATTAFTICHTLLRIIYILQAFFHLFRRTFKTSSTEDEINKLLQCVQPSVYMYLGSKW